MAKKIKKKRTPDLVQFNLRIRRSAKRELAREAKNKKISIQAHVTNLIGAGLQAKVIECACGAIFKVENWLFKEGTSGKREIYCPVGHEISWRGGKLGPRTVTSEMLQREFKKHVQFDFTHDLLEAIREVD